MAKLGSLSKLIRSKNAGPFVLTFDIMFEDQVIYERVKNSGVLSAEVIGRIYSVPVQNVLFFYCDHALAIKASIPRPVTQGDIGDSDGHGGQQYPPLLSLEIPD
jgi:hypothetical protein